MADFRLEKRAMALDRNFAVHNEGGEEELRDAKGVRA